MTKLSNGRWVACTLALFTACGSETGSAASAAGEAGAGPSGTAGAQPSAGTSAGGRGGATANGGAGATAAGAGNKATGTGTAGAMGSAGSSGAAAASGGAGAAGTVAAAGSGGSGTTGATGGAGGSSGAGGEPAAGSGGTASPTTPQSGRLDQTIVVQAGQTFDGKGQRYSAGSALGDGSQDEKQKPLFQLEPGATLENVVLGSPAADGIHCQGDATLRNIVWEDIGEDAMTIKGEGTVKLDGGSAKNGDDKVFQINAESRFEVSNFTAANAGKFIRQNGGTDFKVEVVIDRCDISNMDEAIFRTDSDTSTVEMKNTRYSKIGDELFIGVSAGNIVQQNNTEY